MSRLVVLTLSAAVVLGAAGGAVVATLHPVKGGSARPPVPTTVSSSPPVSPTATPTPDQSNEPLLYASNQRIHDGPRSSTSPVRATSSG